MFSSLKSLKQNDIISDANVNISDADVCTRILVGDERKNYFLISFINLTF